MRVLLCPCCMGVLAVAFWVLLACTPTATPPPSLPATTPPLARPTVVVAATAAPAPPELALVRVSDYQILAGAGHYVADALGYFREEGIQVEFVRSSPPDMLPLLVSGQLDIGITSVNAGLYNAFARGLPLRVVADHGSNAGTEAGSMLLIRKDLVDNGTYSRVADLRGRKVANANTADATTIELDLLLQRDGLTLEDIDFTLLPFADILSALENRAVDAAYLQEPFITIALERGWAVAGPRAGEVYPDHQIGIVLYGERLLRDRDLGLRYMRAYVRGIRTYRHAMWERDPVARSAVIPVLLERTAVKDRALLEKLQPSNLKADPFPNVQTMAADQEWFLSRGLQPQRIDLATVVDLSFVEQVVRELAAMR
ncbi:MAG: ABC transporter substrate-binding protein [Chloroflexi bacterium]|nr:ABC transporter substrate-binding protein [Chloroflexota bacterium]